MFQQDKLKKNGRLMRKGTQLKDKRTGDIVTIINAGVCKVKNVGNIPIKVRDLMGEV